MDKPAIRHYPEAARNNNSITKRFCGEFTESKKGTRILILEARPELIKELGYKYKGIVSNTLNTITHDGMPYNLDSNFLSGNDFDAIYAHLDNQRMCYIQAIQDLHQKLSPDESSLSID
ncbi:hypothetical protein [Neptuniibacter sp. QD37_11]|uniref:hypothetical protein n=1 Tax=Neptuniibacter sp. QD37_11 TaxID=3398209 RepID=UPI0039F50B5F